MTAAPPEISDTDFSVLASLHGFIEFDREAVAKSIRDNTLSPLERHALANLIEARNSDGLCLKLHGQAKRRRIKQNSDRYARCLAIGKRFNEVSPRHETWVGAVEEVAEEFGLSESVIAEGLAAFRFFEASEI